MKFKKKLRKLVVTAGALMLIALSTATTAYAAGGPSTDTQTANNQQQQPVAQSDRWDGTGDTWKVKTPDHSGYLVNSWFQDLDSSWYMLGSDGVMYSGLITDQSTGKSYLLNTSHDGTYGRMITANGVYTLNNAQVYLQFNQTHDGTFGAITSGLSEARSAGVKETQLATIPTDSTTQPQPENPSNTQTPQTPQPAQNNTNGMRLAKDVPGFLGDDNDAGGIDPGHFNGGLNSH